METTFTFQQKGIDKAINNANTLNLRPEQRVIVENLAKLIGSFVSVNELALKGFINNAIIEWQKATLNDVASLATWSPEKRIAAVGAMFANLNTALTKILKYRNESDKLEAAINKAFEFYKKEFAYR